MLYVQYVLQFFQQPCPEGAAVVSVSQRSSLGLGDLEKLGLAHQASKW